MDDKTNKKHNQGGQHNHLYHALSQASCPSVFLFTIIHCSLEERKSSSPKKLLGTCSVDDLQSLGKDTGGEYYYGGLSTTGEVPFSLLYCTD